MAVLRILCWALIFVFRLETLSLCTFFSLNLRLKNGLCGVFIDSFDLNCNFAKILAFCIVDTNATMLADECKSLKYFKI